MNDEKVILKHKNKKEILKKLNNVRYTMGGTCILCSKHISSMYQRKEVMIEGRTATCHKKCLAKLYQTEALKLLQRSKNIQLGEKMGEIITEEEARLIAEKYKDEFTNFDNFETGFKGTEETITTTAKEFKKAMDMENVEIAQKGITKSYKRLEQENKQLKRKYSRTAESKHEISRDIMNKLNKKGKTWV